jgi:hypothetical protein
LKGVTLTDIENKSKQSHYTVKTLLEVAESIEIMEVRKDRYFSTKIAQYFLYDTMTKVNMDFVHDVYYNGAYFL